MTTEGKWDRKDNSYLSGVEDLEGEGGWGDMTLRGPKSGQQSVVINSKVRTIICSHKHLSPKERGQNFELDLLFSLRMQS